MSCEHANTIETQPGRRWCGDCGALGKPDAAPEYWRHPDTQAPVPTELLARALAIRCPGCSHGFALWRTERDGVAVWIVGCPSCWAHAVWSEGLLTALEAALREYGRYENGPVDIPVTSVTGQ